MATSSLGASNTQPLSLKLSQKTKLCMSFLPHDLKAGSRLKAWRHAAVMVSQQSNNAGIICHAQSSLSTKNEPAAPRIEKGNEQRSLSTPVGQVFLNTNQVISLITEICDTTSIADFELKLNGFHLRVRRALSEGMGPIPPSAPIVDSISANPGSEVPVVNGSMSTPSLAINNAGPLLEEGGLETVLVRAAEEGLVIIQSPKVGFFRRSQTIKGKRTPPACKEKQVVKEGQVIFYIDQLGCEIPVESDVSGQVIKLLREDGEPVGYADAIMAILPSFPGT